MDSARGIGPAQDGQAKAVQTTLALAFQDDPALGHLFPDAAVRRRALPRMFAMFWSSDRRAGVIDTAPGCEVAASWRGPGRAHPSLAETLVRTPQVLGIFGGAVLRALRLEAAINRHHPRGPFWYLHFLGCRPDHQGKGWGGAAVRVGLARADAAGLPAFLETATPANVGLYRHLGFEVQAEWHAPDDGPRFWSMLRAPRG
ncbi:GNAT family N-acetyltransferase [Zavarzinia sp. CC-PAN008]|uniref:GNAT family N-acetyltransferase n=1 Tax=Zavarzinia sp. CC-PAN008 TaxID=3243332 RepID=UPI003F7488D4